MYTCSIDLASSLDDAAIRELLVTTPMRGSVSLASSREPSFFDAQYVAGPFRQTIIARAGPRIVGMGERSVRSRFVNGQTCPVGYLAALRLSPSHRHATLMARGFRFLKSLHDDHRTALYLTTIADDNAPVKALLTSARAGLPTYQPAGRYHTFAIPLRRHRPARPHQFNIRTARAEDLPALSSFLNRVGPRRHFFPAYDSSDFFSPSATFRNLQPSDILLALDGPRILGTLAAWDQTPFRQHRVVAYSPVAGAMRPACNLLAAIRGLPRLPPAGSILRSLTAAIPLVENDDRDLFLALLRTLLHQRNDSSWDYLLIGAHDSDPLLPILQGLPSRRYTTCVYLVYWDRPSFLDTIDRRPWHLELGTL